jgi:hypothetical protein
MKSYIEYKKYLKVKEGVGFQWTQDLVGGIQDITKAFTRGRRASAINEYFDSVFNYGQLRGREIGENIGPKLKESIDKNSNFKYEQLLLEIEWSNTAIVNIRKYIFEVIKQVVGEVTSNNIREKIEVPTYLKLISEISNITDGDKNNKIGKPNNITSSNSSSSSNNNTQYGQPHTGANAALGSGPDLNPDMEVKNATWSKVDTPATSNSNNNSTGIYPAPLPNHNPHDIPPVSTSSTTAVLDPTEVKFEDMPEDERIKRLTILDQRLQDFIEMKSPMINKLLKLWSKFDVNPDKDGPENLNNCRILLQETGRLIESGGGNIQSPIKYDTLAHALNVTNNEKYFDFYKPIPNNIKDKELRRFASTMIPGRSLSHTLILLISAISSLQTSLEYVRDKIRRKNRTDDPSLIREAEYQIIISLVKKLDTQSNFVNFELITYKSLRIHFNKYFRRLGLTKGKELYNSKRDNLIDIYYELFYVLPKFESTFITYPKNEETAIKGSGRYKQFIDSSITKDKREIEKIIDSYFGLLLNNNDKEINNQIGNIQLNFTNLINSSNTTGPIQFKDTEVENSIARLKIAVQTINDEWTNIYNEIENADDREDGSS